MVKKLIQLHDPKRTEWETLQPINDIYTPDVDDHWNFRIDDPPANTTLGPPINTHDGEFFNVSIQGGPNPPDVTTHYKWPSLNNRSNALLYGTPGSMTVDTTKRVLANWGLSGTLGDGLTVDATNGTVTVVEESLIEVRSLVVGDQGNNAQNEEIHLFLRVAGGTSADGDYLIWSQEVASNKTSLRSMGGTFLRSIEAGGILSLVVDASASLGTFTWATLCSFDVRVADLVPQEMVPELSDSTGEQDVLTIKRHGDQYLVLNHEMYEFVPPPPPVHEANDDYFVHNDPWVAQEYFILANDVGYVPGTTTMTDEGTGTGTGTVVFNKSKGTVTYLPEPDEYGNDVTLDIRVTDDITADTAVQTLTMGVPMKPMELFLNGVLTPAEIQQAIAAGWNYNFGGFFNSRTTLGNFLDECAVQGVKAFISLDGSLFQNDDVDWLLGHANFASVGGIENEGGVVTDSEWKYMRTELEQVGKEDLLYTYQTHYQADTTVVITNVSVSSGVVTVTAAGHGLSNGETVGISGVAGMTEINYESYTVANAATDTFELSGIDGSSWGAFESGQAPRIHKGSLPTANCWKQRSRLWYPFATGDDPKQSYDPDDSSNSATITNISNATEAVVTTSAAHPYSEGDAVTVRSVSGMTEVNDRQFRVKNPTATSFVLDGENSNGHGTYSGGGVATTSSLGRPKQISVRFDPGLGPLRSVAAWHNVDPMYRRSHYWMQVGGQPMERKDWDDNYGNRVQPGVGHMYTFLLMAHTHRARQASFYTYRYGMFNNYHKDNSLINSESNYVNIADNNSATTIDAQTIAAWERGWPRLLEAVDMYVQGPGNVPRNSDRAWNYETPFVGVVEGGQSATRRGSA